MLTKDELESELAEAKELEVKMKDKFEKLFDEVNMFIELYKTDKEVREKAESQMKKYDITFDNIIDRFIQSQVESMTVNELINHLVELKNNGIGDMEVVVMDPITKRSVPIMATTDITSRINGNIIQKYCLHPATYENLKDILEKIKKVSMEIN